MQKIQQANQHHGFLMTCRALMPNVHDCFIIKAKQYFCLAHWSHMLTVLTMVNNSFLKIGMSAWVGDQWAWSHWLDQKAPHPSVPEASVAIQIHFWTGCPMGVKDQGGSQPRWQKILAQVGLYIWLSERKPATFAPELKFILLAQLKTTLNSYPCPVSLLVNVDWSAFLESNLPTL